MHILIYTYSFFPKVDGVTFRYKNIITEFIKRNIKVTLILSKRISNIPSEFQLILDKCNIIYYEPYTIPYYEEVTLIHPKEYIRSYYQLKKYCILNSIDIIHATAPDIFNIILYQLGKKLNIKVFLFYHTHLIGSVENNNYYKHLIPVFNLLEKQIISIVDGMIFPTEEIYKLLPYNLNNFIMPIALDHNIFYPEYISNKNLIDPKINDFWNYKYKLLYVGRISNDKNVSLIIDLMKKLDKNIYAFLIIGDGPNKKDIIIEKKKLDLNNIFILNNIDQTELRKYYSNVDFYISPSIYETMGFSTLEAIACGTITIGMNSIGTKNIITNGVNGFLVNNSEEIIYYINKINNNSKIKNIIKQNCLNYILDKTFKKSVDKLIEFYNKD
jgi:glycosyltransferase involved in cell wall biosynthesis